MTDQRFLYAMKPQRCFVTISGRALKLHQYMETKLLVATADEPPAPAVVAPKTPPVHLFHHPV